MEQITRELTHRMVIPQSLIKQFADQSLIIPQQSLEEMQNPIKNGDKINGNKQDSLKFEQSNLTRRNKTMFDQNQNQEPVREPSVTAGNAQSEKKLNWKQDTYRGLAIGGIAAVAFIAINSLFSFGAKKLKNRRDAKASSTMTSPGTNVPQKLVAVR